MKTLLLSFLLIISATAPPETKVYVCTGPKVNRYHLTENCRGLTSCHHKLIKTTKAQAEKSGKSLCGWEK